MKALKGVGALVAFTVVLSAWAAEHANAAHASSATWPPTERSTRLLPGGRLRCTATVKSEVEVGHSLTVQFILHNRSKCPVKFSLGVFGVGFDLKAADGTTYRSDGALTGFPVPPSPPRKLRPGATMHVESSSVAVRWRGPLQVTPDCLGRDLPVLRVGVPAPWPGPNQSTVIGQVVAAAGHLLDHCRPQMPGVAVSGQIYPPNGTAAPMDAQCSVSISSQGRFLVAQVLVLTPPGLQGVQIYQPYETLWPIGERFLLPASPPYAAIAWEFVVTRDRATPVAASSMSGTTESAKTEPIWDWNGTGWGSEQTTNCGGGAIGLGTGPQLAFVSACPA